MKMFIAQDSQDIINHFLIYISFPDLRDKPSEHLSPRNILGYDISNPMFFIEIVIHATIVCQKYCILNFENILVKTN